jgi:uncharacterized protein YndB with AHSA1/START domain
MHRAGTQTTVVHDTFTIERTYPAPPSRVFSAFSNPATKRRWFAQGEGRELEEFSSDFRDWGRETTRTRITRGGPPGGGVMRNDTIYLDIAPDRRIVFAYTMALGERRISASLATVELTAVGDTTRLAFTEQAAFFEGADGRERREEGWRKLLERLADEIGKG